MNGNHCEYLRTCGIISSTLVQVLRVTILTPIHKLYSIVSVQDATLLVAVVILHQLHQLDCEMNRQDTAVQDMQALVCNDK